MKKGETELIEKKSFSSSEVSQASLDLSRKFFGQEERISKLFLRFFFQNLISFCSEVVQREKN